MCTETEKQGRGLDTDTDSKKKSRNMEQKMYYRNTKSFRHFISWRQRYRLGRYRNSLHSLLVIIIVIIGYTSASNYSEKLLFNNYNGKINPNSRISSGSEHGRRHSHKYPAQDDIDSFLSSLQYSKNPFLALLDNDRAFDADSCPTCNVAQNDQAAKSLDDVRLEAIKRQILSKLGLRDKPNITLPVPREAILETLSRVGEYQGDGALSGPSSRDGNANKDEEAAEGEPDDFYGRTKEIITFAEPGRLLNGQTLLEFRHPSENDPSVLISQLRVKSAALFVKLALNSRSVMHPVNKNLTLWVFKVKTSLANASFLSGKDFDEYTELVGSLSVALSSVGWQKIDMTGITKDWYRESNPQKEKLRLLVDCSGCKENVQVLIFQGSRSRRSHSRGRKRRSIVNENQRQTETPSMSRAKLEMRLLDDSWNDEYFREESSQLDPNRPYLVVYTEPVVMKRSRRRAMDCTGAIAGQCCKQTFYVNFKELNWEDWIIAPRGYHANYCRGDCASVHKSPDSYSNYHSHVMEEFRKMDRISGVQSCCAPLKYSSVSIIYFGPDSNIIKRDLPKMAVEQCGCP